MEELRNVIVVGAGPTGLLLAGDLAEAGIQTTLIERHPRGSDLTRAFAVHARTLEMLDMRGLAGPLIQRGRQVEGLRLFGRITVTVRGLPSRFPFVLVTPQYEVESLLEERARNAGAEIVRGTEVTGLRQDGAGAEVDLDDGTKRRAAYVVGADGHRSTIRRLAGLPFPGRTVIESVMLADVRLDADPGTLAANPHDHLFAFIAPFGDGYHRVIAWDADQRAPETDPVEMDELRRITRATIGTDFGMHDPRWTSRFHSDERQVPRYRAGRVFLTGDAAHEHSPAGGQGMNTGLMDSANLSWKLAQALTGGPDLLDSYHDERHPVGAAVIRGTGLLLRAAMVRGAPLRALRENMAAVALRTPAVQRQIRSALSGVWVSYPGPPGAHRFTGRRAPDIALRGPVPRLFEALRGGRFVLVSDLPVPAGWEGRVQPARAARPGLPALLVRPDGHVAWAGDRQEGLRQALVSWCGDPVSPARTGRAEAAPAR
ncbi:MAG: FAD-dependent oxidoreductase [Streptosporangiales bacterium]|nr:FAD-dependent oxidoreductase [Streptosporangiales bacterium]